MYNRSRAFHYGWIAFFIFFVYGVVPAWAVDTQNTSEVKRPTYQILRYNEDWTALKDVGRSKTGDFWDQLKYIPILKDQDIWLSLAGQVRERGEYFGEYQFGVGGGEKHSDGYLLSRFRLSTDLHVTQYFRVFVETKSSLATDRDLSGGRSNAFIDTFDFQNAFADIKIPFADKMSVTFRGGRQEMLFGSQRFVGPSDFTNVRRTFDGASAIVRISDWSITPFWVRFVPVRKYRLNKSNSDNRLFGIYASGPFYFLPVNLDLYWLGVNNKSATFLDTSGRERRSTFGARSWGKIGATGLDFEMEGAAQVGRIGGQDILASMFTGILGYSLPITNLTPRAYVEFDYASGGNHGDDVHTFNQLYPTGHAFLGYIDYIGRQNIISPSVGISTIPIRNLSLSLQQYFFWRYSVHDNVYNKSGGILRTGTTDSSRYVGTETDFYATYGFDRHIFFYGGYSHFFPGVFIRSTGSSNGSDYYYTAMQYTF